MVWDGYLRSLARGAVLQVWKSDGVLVAAVVTVVADRVLGPIVDGMLPMWLTADVVAEVWDLFKVALLAAGVAIPAGRYGAREYMKVHAAASRRRLTHQQRDAIAQAFRGDIAEGPDVILIPFGNDECRDFAEDLASAFRMARANAPVASGMHGGMNSASRGVEVQFRAGKRARAEVMVSMLNDFGYNARLGPERGDEGPLFVIAVHRPS